jgi:cytochrome c biogenesis protein
VSRIDRVLTNYLAGATLSEYRSAKSPVRLGIGDNISYSSLAIEVLASMRFAISLLVILAVASVIGTLLTQGDTYPNYVNQFGPFWADIFRGLGLYNLYGAWWFMLILVFLVISVSLCVTRNFSKTITDVRSWKDRVREGSLRAFRHKCEFDMPSTSCSDAAALLLRHTRKMGYRLVTREAEGGAILIAGKRGALTKLGYLSTHLAIVVICVGGLLDSDLPIKLQTWIFAKTATEIETSINAVAPEHRLPSFNPTFRGFALVSEGQRVSSAILSEPDGSLVQDLPFSIELTKFVVDYYSTGMPKLFASDIVVIDRKTGKRVPARVAVNHPFTYCGVSIFQSSFQDGGSRLTLTAWPMTGSNSVTEPFEGAVGGAMTMSPQIAGGEGETVELTDFRAVNVKDVNDGYGTTDTRQVRMPLTLEQKLDARLGSATKSTKSGALRNLGPSVQYKVRNADGQAREYRNYMLPIDISGQQVFLAGVRFGPDDPFRFLRIPADENRSLKEWMNLRAALEVPAMRAQAVRRFVRRSWPNAEDATRKRLEEYTLHVLSLFAGADQDGTALASAPLSGGFQRISDLIDRSRPKGEQEKEARAILHTIEGVTWDLWELSRTQNGEPEVKPDQRSTLFVRASINALSDNFLYGAPMFLQLNSFKQVQASAFQLTRAPGKSVVYLGSILLVLGIFSMFYVRERRIWFLVKKTEKGTANILMAMSTARRTLDFEKEFARTCESIAAVLGSANGHTHVISVPATTLLAIPAHPQDPVR